MQKNAVIAVLCIIALICCYRLEQRVYKTRTYSYYQEQRENKYKGGLKETMEANPVLQDAMDENETYKLNMEQKVAYLTFDDGPSMVTKEVLKTLRENNIHATFFLIGNQIDENTEEIVKQLVEDGHTIGIHTYSHKGAEIYKSKDAFITDFEQTARRIKEVTGIEPKIFRFPWGSVNKYLGNIAEEVIEELEEKGYTYFDWNVSAEDSVGKPTAESILRNVKKDYKKYKQPVILMHDSSVNKLSAQMLPQIIDIIRDAGYQFDTLDKMDKPYQYPRD